MNISIVTRTFSRCKPILFLIKLHMNCLVTFSISFFGKDGLKELDVQRLSKHQLQPQSIIL